ncbi:MAG: exopolysaccharide biosynthesis protein [Alphaproteobacteria bacterium]|nr:exopolysaccharide biosynthesis protein [Alphaproteobacteria bacterium]
MSRTATEDARDPSPALAGATDTLRAILTDLESAASARGASPIAEPDPSAPGRGEPKEGGPTASLGDLLERLDERAFGLIMLLLALPTSIPFVYVLPQIVCLPMLVLAGQMASGRESPWLPKSLRVRTFEIRRFKSVLSGGERYLRFLEHFARPRLAPVTGRLGTRLVGALMFVPLISVLVPLPGTNAVPAAGVAVASLGLIERDGVIVILGLFISFAWVALLLLFGVQAATILKGWLTAHI